MGFDRAAGEHHEGESSRLGTGGSVGPWDDQWYVVVESWGAAALHPGVEGSEDAVAEGGLCRKRRLNPKSWAV